MTQQLFAFCWLDRIVDSDCSPLGLRVLRSGAVFNKMRRELCVGAQNVARFQRPVLRRHDAAENLNLDHQAGVSRP